MKRFALKNDHFRTLCPKVIWIMEGEKSMAEMDQKETEKKRNITVTLSDADSQMLLEKCGYSGISVAELVENFIRDLIYSKRSNGSDEEDLANSWFDRCGFGRYQEYPLLLVLMNHEESGVRYFLNMLENVESARGELETYLNSSDVPEEDTLEALKGDVQYWEEQLKIYASDFGEEISEANLEEEIQLVKDWWTQREQFMRGIEEQEMELQPRQRVRQR